MTGKVGFQVDVILRDRRIDLLSGERKNLVVCSMTQREFKNRRDIASDFCTIRQ